MPTLPMPTEAPRSPVTHPIEIARIRAWAVGVAILVAAFAWPLIVLVRFALKHDEHSHVLIIPFASAYFLWSKRDQLRFGGGPGRITAAIAAAVGIVCLAGFGLRWSSGAATTLANADSLALLIGAFVSFFVGACAWFLGRDFLRQAAFPLGFLVFMIPMPDRPVQMLESFLQHGSVPVAHAFFTVVGTPVFLQDLVLKLPGISIEVAPECSGIRSTIALFITSIAAGHLFLQSPWSRAVLAIAVIPLALLRNGFRVFVIGELCVRIGPEMIDSFIHHHGGPIFFALSLIPFAFLLYWLVRREKRPVTPAA